MTLQLEDEGVTFRLLGVAEIQYPGEDGTTIRNCSVNVDVETSRSVVLEPERQELQVGGEWIAGRELIAVDGDGTQDGDAVRLEPGARANLAISFEFDASENRPASAIELHSAEGSAGVTLEIDHVTSAQRAFESYMDPAQSHDAFRRNVGLP